MSEITVTYSGKGNSESHQPGDIYTRQFTAIVKMVDGVPTIESPPLWAGDTVLDERYEQTGADEVLVTQMIKVGEAGIITVGVNDDECR